MKIHIIVFYIYESADTACAMLIYAFEEFKIVYAFAHIPFWQLQNAIMLALLFILYTCTSIRDPHVYVYIYIY